MLNKLASLQVPVNIIAAEQDQMVSLKALQNMAASIPNSTLQVVANSGHMLPLEQPETLAELLNNCINV